MADNNRSVEDLTDEELGIGVKPEPDVQLQILQQLKSIKGNLQFFFWITAISIVAAGIWMLTK